jgi:hypothetical protein
VTANKHETGGINKDIAYDTDATLDKLNFVDHSADILKHSNDVYGVSDGYSPQTTSYSVTPLPSGYG